MARTDTLGNFLTDVAEAIRNKTGKTDKLTPDSFDTEIESITSTGGGSSESILPAGYTQLEYVKSNGTQRIDTGVLPTEKTDFETTFSSQDTYGSSNFGSIFGTRYTYDVNAYHLGTFNARYGDDLATGTFIFAGTFYSGYMKTDGSKQTVTYKSGIYTGGDGRTWDLTQKTTAPSNNIYLFACYDTLAYDTIDPGKVTLYSCSFSENGEKIRDFIPARRNSDAAIGLFDIVGNKFYTSDIGDPLVAGPDVAVNTQVEDLTEELTAQDESITSQEVTIADIVQALNNKASGGDAGLTPILHPFSPSVNVNDYSGVTSVTTNGKELVQFGQGGFEDTGDLTSLVVPGFVAIFTRSTYTLSDNLEIVAETDITTTYDTPYHKLIVCWCDDIMQDFTVSQETAGRMGIGFVSFVNVTKKPNVEIIKNECNYSVTDNKTLPIKKGVTIYFITSVFSISLLALYQPEAINRRASYYNITKKIGYNKSQRLMIAVTYANEDCDSILDGTSGDSSDIGLIGITIS